MTNPTNKEELVARLEAASEGSRELDGRIWMAIFDPEPGNYFAEIGMQTWHSGEQCEVLSTSSGQALAHSLSPVAIERFTTSLDAALALAERVLAPPFAEFPPWIGVQYSARSNATVRLAFGGIPESVYAEGRTPALALCIAIIRATPESPHNPGQGDGG